MQNAHLMQGNSFEEAHGNAAEQYEGAGRDDSNGNDDGEFAELYGGDGGIQAFVADDEVIDAIDVEVILTEEEEKLIAAQKQRRVIASVICGFVVLAVIVVPLSLNAGDGGSSTAAPTITPTEQPSSAPSSTPTDGGLPQIIDCLSADGITNFDNQNRGSAQWKALLWIANEDEYVREEGLECPDKRYISRYALATIFFEMNGENWLDCGLQSPDCTLNRNQFGWLSNHDVCDWHQIVCSGSDVIGLNFGSQFPNERELTPFIGTFPSEIRRLTDLVQINLKEAFTRGQIQPFFQELSNLQELNFENNDMTGPLPGFLTGDAFPSLQIFLMTGNEFTGVIPSSHGTLKELLQYRVASNRLTGAIPAELADMEGIAYLDLADNDLTGTVPSSLFALTELRILSLHSNDIEGSIPPSVSNLVNLERLRLNSTRFGGAIPPELFEVPNLREINLRGALFNGIIDPSIVNVTFLQIFDVGRNGNITGQIPNIHEIEFLEEASFDFTSVTGELSSELCEQFGTDFGELRILAVDCERVNLPQNCSEQCLYCNPGPTDCQEDTLL